MLDGLMGPLLVGGLVMVAVMIFFVAAMRLISARQDSVEERLQQYGGMEIVASDVSGPGATAKPRMGCLTRLMNGFGLGPALADRLSRSNLALTVPEFALVVLGAAGVGFLLGTWRLGLLMGLVFAVAFGFAPILMLNSSVKRREVAFTQQLPDVMDLLIGSLRAGHGLAQAMNTLVEQLPNPASTEFRRVTRAVELGVSISEALNGLANRVPTQDVTLFVTAITVQHEMGGNLAEILGTIADTVRGRIQLQREIRVLTAQQRLTGYVLAGAPIALAVGISLINPGYMDPLFEPGIWIALPIMSGFMMFIGFMVIRRIVDIEA